MEDEDEDDDDSSDNMALSDKEKHLSLPFRKLARSPVRAAPWSSSAQTKRAVSPQGRSRKVPVHNRWEFTINDSDDVSTQ